MSGVDFELDVSRWVEEAKGRLDQFIVAFALALVVDIQDGTPVVTGRLRASIGLLTSISDMIQSQIIEIGTNVEYARRIEYGFTGEDSLGRYYDQKGAGMFTQTIERAPDIADEVLEEIRGNR